MDSLTLEAAARAMGADPLPVESSSLTCTGASIDTRSLDPGDLFFALKGDRSDGHEHLARALASGAAAAVVRRGADFPRPRGLPLLFVDDPAQALFDLAAAVRARFKGTVVCITGSNGKTTTKEMAAAVAATVGTCVASEHSFNNHLGVPLSILRARSDVKTLVLEIGTNHPGEIARLARLARPRIAVVTNVGEAHLGHFGSLRAIAEEKAALLQALPEDGFAVINGNDDFAPLLATRARGKVCTFGRVDPVGDPSVMEEMDVWGAHARRSARPRGVCFWLYGKMKVTVPVQGLHNVSNALAATAVGLLLGADPLAIRDALRRVEAPRLRLQRERVGGVVLVDDTYNANPASVGAALDEISVSACDGRRVFVLGDMGELGEKSEEHHRHAGRRAASSADVLWAVGPCARAAAEEALAAGMPRDRVHLSPDVKSAVEAPPFEPVPGDLVLLKASRAVALDLLARALRTRLLKPRERETV
jgi:UDP-N-acetylmuramoyl-tripeptide--D-alanyl-D-alanine ligase